MHQPFVSGTLHTPVGTLPLVSSRLRFRDVWGAFKARWGAGRMNYKVDPGLYALGTPNEMSPVMVSANYKMSFDYLRAALSGRDAWILVLDTKGINVWCAAGKGTFGTEELVGRIDSSSLANLVSHRDLILPQLSAPGVSAHTVKKKSGFKVHYGPIRASDLPLFLDSGLKAAPEMRKKSFSLKERVVLIPIELVAALKVALFAVPAILLISGLGGPYGYLSNIQNRGFFAAEAFISAVIAGSVLFPILLPFLPGRAFSLKGFILGAIVALMVMSRKLPSFSTAGMLTFFSWFLIISALTAYLAMNFTGASTYTSLSGVKKEMRWAIPIQAGTILTGTVLWLISFFTV